VLLLITEKVLTVCPIAREAIISFLQIKGKFKMGYRFACLMFSENETSESAGVITIIIG